MKSPVLFLDRDGTINVDIGPEYLSDPDRAKLIDGVPTALAAARKAGFKLAVLTNQAGIAKGLTPPSAIPLVHGRIERLIGEGIGDDSFCFDDIRVCPHHPDDKCGCRKPEVQMLEESMRTLDADPARSFFIGDKDSDLKCAARVGIRSILVRTGHGKKTEEQLKTDPVKGVAGVETSLREAVALAIRLRDQA